MDRRNYTNGGSSRARQEQLRRRKAMQQRLKAAGRNRNSNRGVTILGTYYSYHIYRTRRWAPFVFTIYGFTALIGILWIIFSFKTHVGVADVAIKEGEKGKIEIPKAGAIYQFQIEQIFTSETPLYSELEIEIVNYQQEHVYSFYKDLWQERHSNGEGGQSVYRDLKMEFELELPEAGTYYIRGIPYNDNEGKILVDVKKRLAGNIYLGFFAILYGILSIVLLFSSEIWGTPTEMWQEMIERGTHKNNKQLRNMLIGLTAFVLLNITINITHYGYAKAGDVKYTPTWFYPTNSVFYLG